ncbi:hypothetical protein LM7416_60008 [Listeria monocytogenes]|nr:hypothetical protein LM7416_60008 [Listeria monocytogenes]CUL57365.1 hypothetical protein LM800235_30243 [Listeria monocytogenes]
MIKVSFLLNDDLTIHFLIPKYTNSKIHITISVNGIEIGMVVIK